MKSNFAVPGVAWMALLTFISGWLTQYFGEMTWTLTLVPIIGGVIKMLELWAEPKPQPPPPGVMADPSFTPEVKPNPVVRWLVG
jgi:hypothetical protein